MSKKKYDFSGWATRNNLKCSDGRTIMRDAFKENDGQTVPLIWNHEHNDPSAVLGHALLENRNEGVYAYCNFNDTEAGRNAKLLVEHGDVVSLSIYANQLKQNGGNVIHGAIREVSLVLAGANPGAFIDSYMQHGEESDEEAVIFSGIEGLELEHSDSTESVDTNEKNTKENNMATEEASKENKTTDDKTVEDVLKTFNEEQMTVLQYLIGKAIEDENENKNKNNEGDKNMKHNVFENDTEKNTLSHSEMTTIIADAKRCGTLKESFLAHAEEYGIENIDYLFPDAKNVTSSPEFIKRKTEWVDKILSTVHHTPFSRIKSLFADITEDEARAKGYIKGNLKKEEVFSLLRRTTTPTTIYKKQKLDRDDVIDITDFDTVAWIKSEMRMMLDEEIARAALIGDGRLASDEDKIPVTNIRPVWTDEDLYTVHVKITNAEGATDEDKAKAFIKAVKKSRKNYRGSGKPTLYTTEDMLTDCLLIEDSTGRVIYDTVEKLATALRVADIVTVEPMEGLERESGADQLKLLGIMVNMADYNIGADKGGAVSMFEDFDIDYNAQKYLIETRCSGALIKPYSAVAIEEKVGDVE